MIQRYKLLAERINSELLSIEKVITRAETAIARSNEIDESLPTGSSWHRDLLMQMARFTTWSSVI